uniref:Uncharacterized protein n=1 Tax=Arundo donax TaxID=35708 RepID=A0A0A9BZR9_ARUDO
MVRINYTCVSIRPVLSISHYVSNCRSSL